MKVQSRVIEIYVASDGSTPFSDWLGSLKDIKVRAKIRVRLDRVRLGNLGDCRSVGEGVHELRVDYGPGYRVYFGQDGAKIVVLLTGGNKSIQRKDIGRAQEYWQDYRRRGNG